MRKTTLVEDAQFLKLLDQMGFCWRGYRKVRRGVKRRVARRLQAVGCRSVEAYIALLARDPAERARCAQLMGVPISRFFRDRRLWELLEGRLLPELITAGSPVKSWSAGCARGEEVYSLKICWTRATAGLDAPPELEITATDINPDHLRAAQQGVYEAGSLREVPEAVRRKYFEPLAGGRSWQVGPALRAGIRWQCRDLFASPPGAGFHLVLVRNSILTYCPPARAAPAIAAIAAALAPGGLLVIGARERLPAPSPILVPLPQLAFAYRRKG